MIRTNRLPSEYQEVEYIESTGTQYIDTGVYPDNNTDIDITLMPRQSTGSNVFPFSSRSIVGTPNINAYYANQKLNFEIGSQLITGYYLSVVGINALLDEKLKISLKNNIVYVNEENKGDYSSYSFTSSTSLLLFACRSSNIVDARMFIGRVYKCQIWESNVMTRDYVPCYRKSDNAIGLYDLVNDQFYVNSGTGTFTKGSDIGQHTVKKIKTKVNGIYTELEYAQSDGVGYIDTGVVPKSTTRMVVDMEVVDNTSINFRNGWGSSSGKEAFHCGGVGTGSYFTLCSSASWSSINGPVKDTNRHIFDISNSALKLDNISYGTGNIGNTADSSQTLYLFALHIEYANNSLFSFYQPTKEKIYSAQIYDGTTLIRDFVPCKRNDNVIGLYDKIENKFYPGLEGSLIGGSVATLNTIPQVVDVTEIKTKVNNNMVKVFDAYNFDELYQEVEYLQSTGYQRLHIDLNDNDWLNEGTVYIKFEMVSTANGQALFNDYYYNNNDNDEAGIGVTSGNYVWSSYKNSDYSLTSVSANTLTEITIYNSTNVSFYKINNGEETYFPSSYNSSRAKNVFPAISLFADNTSVRPEKPSVFASMKLYKFMISKQGKKILELIPCYRKSDNKPGMYDLINHKFHINVQTDVDFTVGPII